MKLKIILATLVLTLWACGTVALLDRIRRLEGQADQLFVDNFNLKEEIGVMVTLQHCLPGETMENTVGKFTRKFGK